MNFELGVLHMSALLNLSWQPYLTCEKISSLLISIWYSFVFPDYEFELPQILKFIFYQLDPFLIKT